MCPCRIHPGEHEAGQAWKNKEGMSLAGAVQCGRVGKVLGKDVGAP